MRPRSSTWRRAAAGMCFRTAILGFLLAAGCRGGRPAAPREAGTPEGEYVRSIDQWHEARIRRLTAESGWLSLVGLCWLEEGANDAGRAESNRVAYAAFPAEHLGVFTLRGGEVTFAGAPGAAISGVPEDGRLVPDTQGPPTVLVAGSVRLHVIERGGRYAVRVSDPRAPSRRGFEGIECFPVDPAWRITATLRPAAAGEALDMPTAVGVMPEQAIAGRASFSWQGIPCEIVLWPGDGDELFVVFGDETNGEETYGGGRFLDAVAAPDGRTVVLDFNRSYNPPCAFTPFATCPRPVPENVLSFPVRAGEKGN